MGATSYYSCLGILVIVCISLVLEYGCLCVLAFQEPEMNVIATVNAKCNNGRGCDEEGGFYCDPHYKTCQRCSLCRDPYAVHLQGSTFGVIDVCIHNGLCPRLCRASLFLGNLPRANDTLCQLQHFVQYPDCDLSCVNGGTLDRKTCQCSCIEDWSGSDCSECGLSCVNGGTVDSVSCSCSCEDEWTGKNCSDCGLSFCGNGGTIDETTCRCVCSEDWSGSTCSECGLSCGNGGTVDSVSCLCSCEDEWTGKNCSEPINEPPVSGVSTGANSGNGGSPGAWIAISSIVLLLVCGGFIYLQKKFACIKIRVPGSDVEKGNLLTAEVKVEEATPQSLSVRATRSGGKSKKRVRLVCQTKPGQQDLQLSGEMSWGADASVSHTFSGLDAGTAFIIALQVGDVGMWKELATAEATTAYYSLQVVCNQDGRSATVSGLGQGGWDALEACSCQFSEIGRSWLPIAPGTTDMQLPRVLPGLVYTVSAGVTAEAVRGRPSRSTERTFRCFAKGTLTGNAAIPTGPVCSKTMGDVLDDVLLLRSLDLELKGKDQHYMPHLIAQAFSLKRDNRKLIEDANQGHLDKLHDILMGQNRLETPIHDPMEFLATYMEAENFIWKLAEFTDFRCVTCMKHLHQTHTTSSSALPC